MPSASRSGATAVAALAAAAALAATLLFSIRALRTFREASDRVVQTMRVKIAVADTLQALTDGETGQRGFVITGAPEYLEPYHDALGRLAEAIAAVRALTADNPRQQRSIAAIERGATERLAQLRAVIEARMDGGTSAAAAVIATGAGKVVMDTLRHELAAMAEEEDRLLAAREASEAQKAQIAIGAVVLSSVLFGLLLLLLVGWRIAAAARERATEARAAQTQAENERLEARARVSEFQERFIAILGHDLRNPLASFKMGLELLRRGGAEPSDKVLARMAASSARMGRMVEQLLDLTRCRLADGIPVVRRPCDLGAVVRGVVDQMQAPSIVVEVEGDVTGSWDQDRLEQVIANLAGNALGHGAAGEPVRIAVRGAGDRVVLAVHNQGPAIPEALRGVLFDPFRRGDRDARSERTAGLGLGLYISREIVMAHGGTIEVASADGDGTTFTIDLPRGTGGA